MRQRKLATWLGAVLGILSALLIAAQARGAEQLNGDFHHTYAVSSGQRVSQRP